MSKNEEARKKAAQEDEKRIADALAKAEAKLKRSQAKKKGDQTKKENQAKRDEWKREQGL